MDSILSSKNNSKGDSTPAPTDSIGRLFQMLRYVFNNQALIVAAIAVKFFFYKFINKIKI